MKKAIIVGGSMAGMLAGNMLIRQGSQKRPLFTLNSN